MTHRAERLEDRSVHDVRADRDGRLEAEDEHEHRRHQRAAAHPGHPDEQADEKPASEYSRCTPTIIHFVAYLTDKVS